MLCVTKHEWHTPFKILHNFRGTAQEPPGSTSLRNIVLRLHRRFSAEFHNGADGFDPSLLQGFLQNHVLHL